MTATLELAAHRAIVDAERRMVVREALGWIGTPFHHSAALQYVGVDCGNLLIAVFAGLSLIERPIVAPYPADWFLHTDCDTLRELVARFCVEVTAPTPGDVALYRFGRAASHAAIVVQTEPSLEVVHAFRSRGTVREEAGAGSSLACRVDSYWTLASWVAPCQG